MGALQDAFAQGWSDPRKLAQAASRVRILQNECLESLAHGLGVFPQEIEVIGEPNLAPYWAIAGLLTPKSTLFYSAVDRKEVHAVARAHSLAVEMPVNLHGIVQPAVTPAGSVVNLQAANGETGVIQDLEPLVESCVGSRIVCDFSAAGTAVKLPSRWDSAYFDPKAWQGPQGLGILAISTGAPWRNPLPHLGALRTPFSFSLPLLLASTIALEEWAENELSENQRLGKLTQEFRMVIRSRVADVDIAGDARQSGDGSSDNQVGATLPHITSLSFLYVEGEELLRKLEKRGLSVDSGSACTAEDLQPSHVLAAMGILTHGNIRTTFHRGTSREEILTLADALCEDVADLRGE